MHLLRNALHFTPQPYVTIAQAATLLNQVGFAGLNLAHGTIATLSGHYACAHTTSCMSLFIFETQQCSFYGLEPKTAHNEGYWMRVTLDW
jgi:hypothetical protein